jgi:hypothetical protein
VSNMFSVRALDHLLVLIDKSIGQSELRHLATQSYDLLLATASKAAHFVSSSVMLAP